MSFADLTFFIFMIVLKSSSSLGSAVFTLFSGKFCSFFRNSGAFVNSGGSVSCCAGLKCFTKWFFSKLDHRYSFV